MRLRRRSECTDEIQSEDQVNEYQMEVWRRRWDDGQREWKATRVFMMSKDSKSWGDLDTAGTPGAKGKLGMQHWNVHKSATTTKSEKATEQHLTPV